MPVKKTIFEKDVSVIPNIVSKEMMLDLIFASMLKALHIKLCSACLYFMCYFIISYFLNIIVCKSLSNFITV